MGGRILAETSVERRAHDRRAGGAGATTVWLRAPDGERLLAVVVDHGQGGARIELSGYVPQLQPGSVVGLEPKNATDATSEWSPHGEVVWVDGVHLGLRFLDDGV